MVVCSWAPTWVIFRRQSIDHLYCNADLEMPGMCLGNVERRWIKGIVATAEAMSSLRIGRPVN